MKILDINTWNRKQHFHHFMGLTDPYFEVTVPFDVSKAYQFSKNNNISFFARYLHDCMKAINAVKPLKLRILQDDVVAFETIHASATLMRDDHTYGFSFIEFDEDLTIFTKNIELEKERVKTTNSLFSPKNGFDCIHCSAMPWLNFIGHKEPVSNASDSVPKLAFSKATENNGKLVMNVSVCVNHALVDGYDVSMFSDKFQHFLNR